MKENWINKLVELLNEYESSKAARDYTRRIEKQNKIRICWTEYTWAYVDDEEAERIIISKKYKFIKFLVDYDKIGIPSLIWRFDEYETVLCNLAISYTPIETLISYLR